MRAGSIFSANCALTVPVGVMLTAPLAGTVLSIVTGFGGGGTLTTHETVAGDGSVLPAGSVAATENVCGPFPRPGKLLGVVHDGVTAPSSEHVKVEFVSLEVNANVPVALVEGFGGELVIAVSGGTATTHVNDAGAPVSPSAVGVTVTVCVPSARPTYACTALEQSTAAPPSS